MDKHANQQNIKDSLLEINKIKNAKKIQLTEDNSNLEIQQKELKSKTKILKNNLDDLLEENQNLNIQKKKIKHQLSLYSQNKTSKQKQSKKRIQNDKNLLQFFDHEKTIFDTQTKPVDNQKKVNHQSQLFKSDSNNIIQNSQGVYFNSRASNFFNKTIFNQQIYNMNPVIQNNLSSYYPLLKREVKIYQNMESILDKIELEGNMNLLTTCFDQIIQKEMVYAVNGNLKRAKKIIWRFFKVRPLKIISQQHNDFQREFKNSNNELKQLKKQKLSGGIKSLLKTLQKLYKMQKLLYQKVNVKRLRNLMRNNYITAGSILLIIQIELLI